MSTGTERQETGTFVLVCQVCGSDETSIDVGLVRDAALPTVAVRFRCDACGASHAVYIEKPRN